MTSTRQHNAKVWLTHDLALEFSVFEHPDKNQVPEKVWEEFVLSYHHAHGSDPANSLTEYVVNANWLWETVLTGGAIVIDDPDGPLCLEDSGQVSPEGARIVFWNEGTPYDTGLRVWEQEASLITRLLREKKETEDRKNNEQDHG